MPAACAARPSPADVVQLRPRASGCLLCCQVIHPSLGRMTSRPMMACWASVPCLLTRLTKPSIPTAVNFGRCNIFVSRRDRTQTDHTVNKFNPKAPCVGEVRGSDRLHVDDWSGPASPRPPPPRLKLLRAKHCSSAGKTVSLRYYRWLLMLESNGRESSCYPSVWLLERNTRWLERRPSMSMT